MRRRYAPYSEPQSKSNTPAPDSDKTTQNGVSGSAPQVSARPELKLDFRTDQVVGNNFVARNSQEREEATVQWPAQPQASVSNSLPTSLPVAAGLGGAIEPIQQTLRNNAQETQDLYSASRIIPYDEDRSEIPRSSAQSTATQSDPADVYNDIYSKQTTSAPKPPYQRLTSPEDLSQRSEKEEILDIFSELMTGSEHEISFFLRHFSEVLGPWLDLSDPGKFFSVYVPIRAIDSLFLKYAVAALSAKHLGRVKGAKSITGGGIFTNPATTEIYPNSSRVDWFLKGANYYYLAVSNMQTVGTETYGSLHTSAVLGSPFEIVDQLLKLLPQSGFDELATAGFTRKIEDLMAATAILYMYKILDANEVDSHSHLSGIGSVFDTLIRLKTAGPLKPPPYLHGTRAAFWDFARLDYLTSYMNRSATHLDPENLPLWQAAGLPIDEQGNIHHYDEAVQTGVGFTREDFAANTLTWLATKVINFLAQYRELQMAQWSSPTPSSPLASGQPAASTTSTWLKLCFEFQSWFEELPETFRPCVRIERPRDLSVVPQVSHLPFPEIVYTKASCAATMQQYHFARIALLLNRPPDIVNAHSSAFDRLQGYREVSKEVEYRTREICGIALGRPQGAVRIYMVPLLFAVGQCLEKPEERQVVANILRGIEADLGWATEYAIEKLQGCWNQ